jgi:CHAT domain-containing protein
MTLEQQSEISLIDSFPAQIQLTIQSTGNGYIATLGGGTGRFQRFPLQLTPHDVKALNMQLQTAIEQVAASLTATGIADETVAQLAETGNYVFKRLFPQGPTRHLIEQTFCKRQIVQISSDSFAIPWELLYDGPLADQVSIEHFWGMKHIIARAIIQEISIDDFVSPVIQSSRPLVGLITYNQLEHVAQQEIPALQHLHRSKRIKLSHLKSLNSDKREQSLLAFGRFLGKKQHLVHFACHAHEQEPIEQSFLRISDEFAISMKDFGIYEFLIKGHPFIILNACLTSVMNPLYTSYWAAAFLQRGVRGVLATELHIPDQFAAAFMKEFYEHLLQGMPIGAALLKTRQHFWQHDATPLGLAYALYASPFFRIITTNE